MGSFRRKSCRKIRNFVKIRVFVKILPPEGSKI
jgi:hypothetical protein